MTLDPLARPAHSGDGLRILRIRTTLVATTVLLNAQLPNTVSSG